MPRLRFKDADGEHRLMLRDWGCFEFMRKNEHRPGYYLDEMASALRLGKRSSILVGNMNNQRRAWLIISVLNGIREEPTLFDSLLGDVVA
jgi:hypothetical protein